MDAQETFKTFENLAAYQTAREFRKAMYVVARGSLEELLDDLNVCADEKYLPTAEIEKLKQDGWRVSQLLGGYIRFLRKCKAGESLALREMPVEYATAADDEFSDATM